MLDVGKNVTGHRVQRFNVQRFKVDLPSGSESESGSKGLKWRLVVVAGQYANHPLDTRYIMNRFDTDSDSDPEVKLREEKHLNGEPVIGYRFSNRIFNCVNGLSQLKCL